MTLIALLIGEIAVYVTIYEPFKDKQINTEALLIAAIVATFACSILWLLVRYFPNEGEV